MMAETLAKQKAQAFAVQSVKIAAEAKRRPPNKYSVLSRSYSGYEIDCWRWQQLQQEKGWGESVRCQLSICCISRHPHSGPLQQTLNSSPLFFSLFPTGLQELGETRQIYNANPNQSDQVDLTHTNACAEILVQFVYGGRRRKRQKKEQKKDAQHWARISYILHPQHPTALLQRTSFSWSRPIRSACGPVSFFLSLLSPWRSSIHIHPFHLSSQ